MNNINKCERHWNRIQKLITEEIYLFQIWKFQKHQGIRSMKPLWWIFEYFWFDDCVLKNGRLRAVFQFREQITSDGFDQKFHSNSLDSDVRNLNKSQIICFHRWNFAKFQMFRNWLSGRIFKDASKIFGNVLGNIKELKSLTNHWKIFFRRLSQFEVRIIRNWCIQGYFGKTRQNKIFAHF